MDRAQRGGVRSDRRIGVCCTRLASRLSIPFTRSTPNARPGINVSNTPGAVDEATATTALYLIISTLRHFSKAERSLLAGTWRTPISPGDTHDLSTRTLGILGLGGIGLVLAHLVHAFPMRVLYYSRRRRTDVPEWCEYVESVDALCARSDVLSVHVPLREETRGLVGERQIRAMKRGSVVVNTARGGVLDEAAVIRALEDGHVRIGLFVFAPATTLTVVGVLRFSVCDRRRRGSSWRRSVWTCSRMNRG
jgi:lactate dehydrogenase-like 2-hydroxyacid dehydrogenase